MSGDTRSSAPEGARMVEVKGAYLDALLRGRRVEALDILRAPADRGVELPLLYMHVIHEALYDVGRLWERNKISVAEEHMATAIAQWCLSSLYGQLPVPTTVRGRAVIAGVQGELHQVGANIVSDVLESDGWDVRFLGTDMPYDGIFQAVVDHEADVLGISVAMVFNLHQVRRMVQAARAALGDAAPAMVPGGCAMQFAPGMTQQLGAAGVATDVLAARRLFASLPADEE